jgi:hypothetical protein
MAVHRVDSIGHSPRSMGEIRATPKVPSARSTMSAWVEPLETPRSRSNASYTAAEAISGAAGRDTRDPPAATAAERDASAGLEGLSA